MSSVMAVFEFHGDSGELAAHYFRRVLNRAGLPDPVVRTYPVHNLGWPVDASPLYR